jgi:hypothetical protein
MKTSELMNPAHVFLEIGQDWLKAFNGTAGLDLPLERSADGRLTETCKANLVRQLQAFIQHKSWQPRARVFCALGSRGVSLRRLSLPAASKEELQRLLALQIESEFPLPPEQLAWGCQTLNGTKAPHAGANGKQDLLVAAVKKDSLDEYAGVLALCGANPVFTLAALARSYVCPQPPGSYAVLAVERAYSELITFESGVPVAVRVLPWGGDNLSGTPASQRGNAPGETSFGGSGPISAERVSPDAVDPLVRLLNGLTLGRRIYVVWSGDLTPRPEFTTRLADKLGNEVDCQGVELSLGQARSAAILGLQKAIERPEGWPPLVLQAKQTNGKASRIAQQAPLKWAAAALGLLLLAVLLPYAEALTLKSHLAKKLAAIKTDQVRLATMDRELDFLQYLQQNQAPYLDALLVLAKAAPPGARFDSVSMNRRGELSLRGSLQNGQLVAELRSKLIDSGFFDSVGIEEQAPSPDHQKVTVRMNAQWKPADSRKTPALEPGRAAAESKRPPNSPAASSPPTSPPPGQPAKATALKKGPQ